MSSMPRENDFNLQPKVAVARGTRGNHITIEIRAEFKTIPFTNLQYLTYLDLGLK